MLLECQAIHVDFIEMKKLNARYKLYLLRKSMYVFSRHLKLSRLHSKKKRELTNKKHTTERKTTITILAPENFFLGFAGDDQKSGYPETRMKLLTFIRNIKHSLHVGKKVHISFKNTKWLAPSGTLIFVAEL